MITSAQCESIHALYNKLTKQDHKFTMSCFFTLEMWLSRGYTEADLKLVTDYLWRRIKLGKRQRECFRFSLLMGDIENFEEIRSMAQSEATIQAKEHARTPVASPDKKSVLRSSGRPETGSERNPEHAAAIVRRLVEQWEKSI